MAIALCFCLIVFLEAFLICRPFNYNWDKTIKGSCSNELNIYLGTSIINLLIDVMVIVLPMPMLWRLQMSLSKKIALTGIFGMGAGYAPTFSYFRCPAFEMAAEK